MGNVQNQQFYINVIHVKSLLRRYVAETSIYQNQRNVKELGPWIVTSKRNLDPIQTDATTTTTTAGAITTSTKSSWHPERVIILKKELNDVDEFIPDLPAYEKIITEPTRSIYGYDGNYFSSLIESFYDEGVFWRKNVFKIPSGKAGKAFIKLQTE